ncbi:MAG: YihY/virulence factor BrkB family protein [Deltaproteobacteria bacterium]|nr:YihY/virulence factor BrkB family protein [Deltaproteobacteria bacterium]
MTIRRVLSEAWRSYRLHDGPLLSGAVAFYGLLSVAPFGVMGLAVASRVFGGDVDALSLASGLEPWVGAESASFVADMIQRTSEHGGSGLAGGLGLVFVLFATSRLFLMLHAALNLVLGVRAKVPESIRGRAWRVLRKRLLAFAMVLLFGAALVLFLGIETMLFFAADRFGGPDMHRALPMGTALLVMTAMLTLLYRWLPDARLAWRDTFLSAAFTAVMSAVGSVLFGSYLAMASPASAYGAAGSLVLLLLWFYYSAQIFFLGAEVGSAAARESGRGVRPLPSADRIGVQERHTLI